MNYIDWENWSEGLTRADIQIIRDEVEASANDMNAKFHWDVCINDFTIGMCLKDSLSRALQDVIRYFEPSGRNPKPFPPKYKDFVDFWDMLPYMARTHFDEEYEAKDRPINELTAFILAMFDEYVEVF